MKLYKPLCEIQPEVKIAYNKPIKDEFTLKWYKGCFTLHRCIYEEFVGVKDTINEEYYISFHRRKELLDFFKTNGIHYDHRRACIEGMAYYIRIVH